MGIKGIVSLDGRVHGGAEAGTITKSVSANESSDKKTNWPITGLETDDLFTSDLRSLPGTQMGVKETRECLHQSSESIGG